MQSNRRLTCPICDTDVTMAMLTNPLLHSVECRRCGHFATSNMDEDIIRAHPSRWLLGVECRNRFIRDATPLFIGARKFSDNPPAIAGYAYEAIDEIVARREMTFGGQLDIALVNMSLLQESPGKPIALDIVADQFVFASQDGNTAQFVMDSLHEIGLVSLKRSGTTSNNIMLTPKGWAHVEALRTALAHSHDPYCFVAMWFDPSLSSAFDEAITPAISSCGFKVHRVDRKEHNNRIDDEIIAEIRSCAFVVADFTGHRGGVYFEAGYARGLGKPVISMVREDHLKDVHFDTRQYSHIVWRAPDDLMIALRNRILATIGRAQ